MKNLEETFGGIRKLLYFCTTTPKDQSVNYILLLSEKALARNLKLKISVEKQKHEKQCVFFWKYIYFGNDIPVGVRSSYHIW